jgi:hypothetical protein
MPTSVRRKRVIDRRNPSAGEEAFYDAEIT